MDLYLMNKLTATPPPPREEILAYNLWQLENERIGRERRMLLRVQQFLSAFPAGFWKRPIMWACAFSFLFMTHDAFATLIVELIVQAGN
jgi:hypothetical protein